MLPFSVNTAWVSAAASLVTLRTGAVMAMLAPSNLVELMSTWAALKSPPAVVMLPAVMLTLLNAPVKSLIVRALAPLSRAKSLVVPFCVSVRAVTLEPVSMFTLPVVVNVRAADVTVPSKLPVKSKSAVLVPSNAPLTLPFELKVNASAEMFALVRPPFA